MIPITEAKHRLQEQLKEHELSIVRLKKVLKHLEGPNDELMELFETMRKIGYKKGRAKASRLATVDLPKSGTHGDIAERIIDAAGHAILIDEIMSTATAQGIHLGRATLSTALRDGTHNHRFMRVGKGRTAMYGLPAQASKKLRKLGRPKVGQNGLDPKLRERVEKLDLSDIHLLGVASAEIIKAAGEPLSSDVLMAAINISNFGRKVSRANINTTMRECEHGHRGGGHLGIKGIREGRTLPVMWTLKELGS